MTDKCCALCFGWKPNNRFGKCQNPQSSHCGQFTNGSQMTCPKFIPMPLELEPDHPRLALANADA